MKTPDEVADRISHLLYLNRTHREQRAVTRAILNGGPQAVIQLVGDDAGEYLPSLNIMASGIERLAQKTQEPPVTKVDPPVGKEGERERRRAEQRERITDSHDRWCKLQMQLPQFVRWLAGYGFAISVVEPGTNPNGEVYPQHRLRDPFGAFLAPWGIDQDPEDVVFVRRVPEATLRHLYGDRFNKATSGAYPGGPAGAVLLDREDSGWENPGRTGMVVHEYMDDDGIHVMLGNSSNRIDFIPAECGKPFVVAKRFSFDQVIGQYEHDIGIMQMMARLNLLAFISTTDDVFRETNVYGDMVSGTYERGRDAVNHFTAGTRVERPTSASSFEAFQQIDRLERYARIQAGYPATDDAQSPTAWATGAGLRELNSGSDNLAREYQTVLKHHLESVDRLRLEMDDKLWPDETRQLAEGGNYTPSKDIKGNYVTRRVYGAMAGLDSSAKTIGLINLVQTGLLDRVSAMENMDGIDDVQRVLDRLRMDETRDLMKGLINAMLQGQPFDDRAARLLVAQLPQGDERDLYESILFPEEDDITAPEAVAPEPEPLVPEGSSVVQALARLNGDGAGSSGVQTISTAG